MTADNKNEDGVPHPMEAYMDLVSLNKGRWKKDGWKDPQDTIVQNRHMVGGSPDSQSAMDTTEPIEQMAQEHQAVTEPDRTIVNVESVVPSTVVEASPVIAELPQPRRVHRWQPKGLFGVFAKQFSRLARI